MKTSGLCRYLRLSVTAKTQVIICIGGARYSGLVLVFSCFNHYRMYISMIYTQTGSATRTSLIVILVIGGLLAVAVMLLPKGFSDDLSKIGQGSATVVLTHDKNSVESMEFMELLNKVRSDYAGKVDFLAVDINTRQGQVFSRRQNVGAAVLVLFDPDGVKRGVLYSGIDEQKLRSEIEHILTF